MNDSVSDLRKLARVTKERELNSPGLTARAVIALTGVTIHQLRYWDETYLVVPSIQGTGGRTGVPRIYSREDVRRIHGICALLSEGWSLQALRRQFGADAWIAAIEKESHQAGKGSLVGTTKGGTDQQHGRD